jgi:hypothetical protein
MKEFLISGGITLLATIITTFVVTAIKQGKIENWGVSVGKFLDKIGRQKMGTEKWEKIEDVITTAFISFAHGIKKGADWDDNEVQNLIETGNRNGIIKKQ